MFSFQHSIYVFIKFHFLKYFFFLFMLNSLSCTAVFHSSLVKCAFPFTSIINDKTNKMDNRQNRLQVNIGPCKWIFSEKCPNSDIKFFLYTKKNPQDRQLIYIDETWDKSNLSDSHFNPNDPSKIILHGYNSDMFLTPLIQMKGGMLFSTQCNSLFIFFLFLFFKSIRNVEFCSFFFYLIIKLCNHIFLLKVHLSVYVCNLCVALLHQIGSFNGG